MSNETIAVEEVAKRLKLNVLTVQNALRTGDFPVGFAIKCQGGRYRYIIPRAAFENMMVGKAFV